MSCFLLFVFFISKSKDVDSDRFKTNQKIFSNKFGNLCSFWFIRPIVNLLYTKKQSPLATEGSKAPSGVWGS